MREVNLLDSYKPSSDEEYMNDMQLEYFRRKLHIWRDNIINQSNDARSFLQSEDWKKPDFNDRASTEIDASIKIRTTCRYRKLLDKIDDAVKRIDNKEYGYCEKTGNPIGLERLEARPIAVLSIEAQLDYEDYEDTHIDDKET